MILRLVALRIELQSHARAVDGFLARRVIVQVEADLRSGLHQLGGAFRQDVAVLADGKLVEEALVVGRAIVETAGQHFVLIDVLNQVGEQVMHDGARAGTGLGFDGLQISIFGESRIGDVIDPQIAAGRGHRVRLRNLHDQIGLCRYATPRRPGTSAAPACRRGCRAARRRRPTPRSSQSRRRSATDRP